MTTDFLTWIMEAYDAALEASCNIFANDCSRDHYNDITFSTNPMDVFLDIEAGECYCDAYYIDIMSTVVAESVLSE